MKVLGINTSPRENSNVRFALEAALEASAEKGAETEIIDVNPLTISPCQADNYCKANNSECGLNDDMADIYKKIEEADGIILASPIYFFDVTAQAKAVIDRLYCYFGNEEFAKLFSTKKVSIITTNGGAPLEAFESSLNTQMQAFGALGFQTGDIIALGGNMLPGEIQEKEDQLEKAKEVGKNII
ncbi:flavodoxin family protein [Methanobrevibacter sp.]|uniref:flavodoxin family protein n=1 Tax=Methanobrevibacter sp. TaxID=66852 RepID=UPI00386708CD